MTASNGFVSLKSSFHIYDFTKFKEDTKTSLIRKICFNKWLDPIRLLGMAKDDKDENGLHLDKCDYFFLLGCERYYLKFFSVVFFLHKLREGFFFLSGSLI